MHFLILSIVSCVCIAAVILWNESSDLDRYGVMLFNYLTASVLSLVLADRSGIFAVAVALLGFEINHPVGIDK
jgi:hypothetical protein